MASVFQRGKVWYGKFKDASGTWRQQATKAQSKTEAKRLIAEVERKAERQRLGLEVRPDESGLTFGELCEWWLKNRCPEGSLVNEQCRLRKHIVSRPIGTVPVRQLTAARIEDRLREMEAAGIAPVTINGMRRVLNTVFGKARKAGVWTGTNPVEEVERRREPKPLYETLRAEEVDVLLPHVPDQWRDFFAAAVYAGLRKGELCGLRKSDVNLKSGTMVVARSYDGKTTKGGHADIVPIAAPLLPYLRHAIESSTSELVFPGEDGTMRTKEADPQKVLKAALGRAGLVEGYLHSCRRCKRQGEPHEERHADPELRVCPKCGMKLWPSALPRQMRFHDLRHSTATILLRAGVDAHRVQRIMRHKDVKTTTSIYGHLEVEDLRDAVNQMPLSPVSTALLERVGGSKSEALDPSDSACTNAELRPFGAPVVQLVPRGKRRARTAGETAANPGPYLERETGFEPATLSLGS